MTKLTKAQLVDQLEVLRAQYERLAVERDSLRAECEALREAKPVQRTWPVAPSSIEQRRAAMAAAKAAAMAGGKTVRVW